jgi:HEAT repeat protein
MSLSGGNGGKITRDFSSKEVDEMKRIGAILLFLCLLLPLKVKGDIADIERELKDISPPAGGQPPDAYDKLLAKIRLREQWHPALKKVDIIKILEDVKWENVKWEKTQPYLYFSAIVSPFLGIPNLHIVVGEGPFDYDAVLKISASFRALSKKYNEGVLYTGAYVEGKISLETREGFKIEDNFRGNIEPPDELPIEVKQHIDDYKSPESAPFRRVLDVPGSFIDKFAKIYYKCFGLYALAVASFEGDPLTGAPYQSLSPLLEEVGEQLFDPIVYLLKNSKWEWIQIGSAIALEKTKLPKAIPYLLEYATRPSTIRWEEIVDNVAKIVKEKGGIEIVIDCLKSGKPGMRGLALEVLGRLGGDKAVEELISALKDESPNVRMTAVRWLGNLKDKRAVEPLIAVLKNKKEQEEIRAASAYSLGAIQDPRAHQPLMEVLQQYPSDEISEAIQRALQVVPVPTPSPEDIPNLINRWRSAVEHENYPERNKTEELLKAAGSKVVDGFLPIITNKKEKKSIREAALQILLNVKDKRLIEPCLKIAKDKEETPTIRQIAIHCLGNLKAKEASNLLFSFLTDVKQPLWLREVSASNLGKIGDTRSIEALYFTLKLKPVSPPVEKKEEENGLIFYDIPSLEYREILAVQDLRFFSAEALVSIGMPALERIKDALSDDDPGVRAIMARALGESKEQWAKELLLSLMQDEDVGVRLAVSESLVGYGDSRSLEMVLSVLGDEKADIWQKGFALDVLGKWETNTKSKLNDKRFVEPLIAFLKQLEENKSYYEIDDVLRLVSQINDPSALKGLSSLLNSENKDVRNSALNAILQIGPSEEIMSDLIYTSKNDEEAYIRESALNCLAKLSNPTAINAIVEAYKYDPETGVRSQALSLLEKLKSPYSIKPLAEFLFSCQDALRKEEVAKFLRWADCKGATEVIIPYLKDKDPQVRKSAAEALGYLQSPYGVEGLLELMTDENKEVREAVIKALREIANENYGEDVGKWRIWWEQNKDRLLKQR